MEKRVPRHRISLQMDDNFYRWLYTSITRSAKMLYLINLPADFISLSK